jgi:alcohol dehydrogenase class IV
MVALGVPTRLSDIGLTTVEQLSALIGSVNDQRLANNPRRLGVDDLRHILEGIR